MQIAIISFFSQFWPSPRLNNFRGRRVSKVYTSFSPWRSRQNKEFFESRKANFIGGLSIPTKLEALILGEAVEPRFDIDFALKGHLRRKCPDRGIYMLSDSHLRAISRLWKQSPTVVFCRSKGLYGCRWTYRETGLVEVIDIVGVDTILKYRFWTRLNNS